MIRICFVSLIFGVKLINGDQSNCNTTRSCLEMVNSNTTCQVEGARTIHPENPAKFLVCLRNPINCKTGRWGQLERDCLEGEQFNETVLDCSLPPKSPEHCPPRASDQSVCTAEIEPDLSENCRRMFACFLIKTCPGTDPYWHEIDESCNHETYSNGMGEFYSIPLEKCVTSTSGCPQDGTCSDTRWDKDPEKGLIVRSSNIGICRISQQGNVLVGAYLSNCSYPEDIGCYVPLERAASWVAPLFFKTGFEVLSAENRDFDWSPVMEELVVPNAVIGGRLDAKPTFIVMCAGTENNTEIEGIGWGYGNTLSRVVTFNHGPMLDTRYCKNGMRFLVCS